MKTFFKKRSPLILLIISILILGTLFFNYLEENVNWNADTLAGYRAILGNKVLPDEDLLGLRDLVFNWTLAIAFLSPFILSLLLLILRKPLGKHKLLKRLIYVLILFAFISLFYMIPNIVTYLEGRIVWMGSTLERTYNPISYDVLIFADIAKYLALAGALVVAVELLIED